MTTTFIYALCEPGTRTVRYIGKADKLKKRFQEHLRTSIKYRSHLGNWLRSIVSRGEKPVLVVLREVPFDQWEIAEERYIRLARGCGMNLVNETDGGEGMSNPSPEVLEKLSAARQGDKNPMFGKKFTPEHCANISAALLGRVPPPFTPEHCENIRRARLGVRHSPERCENISKAKLGKKHSPEHRANSSEARRGRKHQGSSSKFIGVTWDRRERKWAARIHFEGRTFGLKTFKTEVEAAKAYDARATILYGVAAKLNFPI